ncbi:MAG: LptF/LptG family permease [Deltaproteobacteria bacterium]|nr:LptF/LptG family permease [Deltaproteobacteria bacterium]
MRIPWTLSRYLLREVAGYTLIGLFAVGALLLLPSLLRRLEDLIALGITPAEAGRLLLLLAGRLAGYVLPFAFVFGVMVALARLSADSEITALEALGVGSLRLVWPVALLGALTAAVTALLLNWGEPLARRDLRALVLGVAARGGIIEAGALTPLDKHGARLLFVDRRERNRLQGVLLHDQSNPQRPFTVVAARGDFSFDKSTALAHLRLRGGDVHFEPQAGAAYQRIAFEGLDYTFDMNRLLGGGGPHDPLDPLELTTPEVLEVIGHFERVGHGPPRAHSGLPRYQLEWQRRMALAAAPLLFALAGFPLGAGALRRGKRAHGALLCAALVAAYYLLLQAGDYLALRTAVPVGPAIWAPNALFAALAAALLARRAGLRLPLPRRARARIGDGGNKSGGVAGARWGWRRGVRLPPEFRLITRRGALLAARGDLLEAALDLGLLEAGGLEAAFAQSPPGATGRGATALLGAKEDGRLLLRRLVHGGALAGLLGDCFASARRPLRELAVTAALRARGAPVPRPALVAGRRRGLCWSLAIATFYEEGTRDLLRVLRGPGPGPAQMLHCAAAAGRAVRRFHDLGGRHADLQAANLLLRETPAGAEVLLIDLDRARLGPPPAPAARMAEIMRLYRSLLKRGVLGRVGPRGCARFFSAYCGADRPLRRALWRRLPRELRRIARHARHWR